MKSSLIIAMAALLLPMSQLAYAESSSGNTVDNVAVPRDPAVSVTTNLDSLLSIAAQLPGVQPGNAPANRNPAPPPPQLCRYDNPCRCSCLGVWGGPVFSDPDCVGAITLQLQLVPPNCTPPIIPDTKLPFSTCGEAGFVKMIASDPPRLATQVDLRDRELANKIRCISMREARTFVHNPPAPFGQLSNCGPVN